MTPPTKKRKASSREKTVSWNLAHQPGLLIIWNTFKWFQLYFPNRIICTGFRWSGLICDQTPSTVLFLSWILSAELHFKILQDIMSISKIGNQVFITWRTAESTAWPGFKCVLHSSIFTYNFKGQIIRGACGECSKLQ